MPAMRESLQSPPLEAAALYSQLRSAAAELIDPHGKTHRLPNSLSLFLDHLVTEVMAGKHVSISLGNAAFTTMEAARTLGVSRQFLVQLLEKGEMSFHRVGTHRRIYARDLLAYKARRDGERRRLLDELVLAEMQDGTYDSIPINGSLTE
jgi:excisionase family DNA binding protein